MAMFAPKSEWIPPMELPDITAAKKKLLSTWKRETPIIKTNGPGWATGNGEVVGYAVAVDGCQVTSRIRHLGGKGQS